MCVNSTAQYLVHHRHFISAKYSISIPIISREVGREMDWKRLAKEHMCIYALHICIAHGPRQHCGEGRIGAGARWRGSKCGGMGDICNNVNT